MIFFYRIYFFIILLVTGIAYAEPLPVFSMGFYLPVIRDVPRKDVEISLRFWIEEVCKSVDVNCKPVRFYDDQNALKQALNDDTINFVVATSMCFVQNFPTEELSDGFSGYKLIDDDLLLVVRRDAAIHSPANLKGKRMALLDSDELTDIYLGTLLMKAGMKSDLSQLSSLSRETRSSKQVYQLFFDKADAALIYRSGYETALELNPQIGQRMQVLEKYTFKNRSPHTAFFSSRVNPLNREMIIKAGLKLAGTPRGLQVLQLYQSTDMERTKVSDLLPYHELLNTYQTLRKAAGMRKK